MMMYKQKREKFRLTRKVCCEGNCWANERSGDSLNPLAASEPSANKIICQKLSGGGKSEVFFNALRPKSR